MQLASTWETFLCQCCSSRAPVVCFLNSTAADTDQPPPAWLIFSDWKLILFCLLQFGGGSAFQVVFESLSCNLQTGVNKGFSWLFFLRLLTVFHLSSQMQKVSWSWDSSCRQRSQATATCCLKMRHWPWIFAPVFYEKLISYYLSPKSLLSIHWKVCDSAVMKTEKNE